MDRYRFVFIGGDERSAYAARALASDGCCVRAVGLEKSKVLPASLCADAKTALARADVVVLPVPLMSNGNMLTAPLCTQRLDFVPLMQLCKTSALLFAGKVPPFAAQYAREAGRTLVDICLDEEFLRDNAILTAEGTLELIMRRTRCSVLASRVAVVGYGRTGKAICSLFCALGARVCVFARSESARAAAKHNGCEAYDLAELPLRICAFDSIVNTAPARVFSDEALANLRPDSFIADIASAPYGASEEAASRWKSTYERAPSLPGRCSPRSAGETIVRCVKRIMEQRGMLR